MKFEDQPNAVMNQSLRKYLLTACIYLFRVVFNLRYQG